MGRNQVKDQFFVPFTLCKDLCQATLDANNMAGRGVLLQNRFTCLKMDMPFFFHKKFQFFLCQAVEYIYLPIVQASGATLVFAPGTGIFNISWLHICNHLAM
jgi:hypothetical protein